MRIFCLFFLILSISSCSLDRPSSSTFVHHEYSEIEDKMISYLDVFKMEEEKYYLYYFQLTCYHCHGIKSTMIDFALNSKDKVYFINIEKDEGFLSLLKEETIGTNDPLKAFARMTPQFSVVENGFITHTVCGKEDILELIENIKQ